VHPALRPLGIPETGPDFGARPSLNLLSITGEWQGFDEDWLLRRVQARRSASGSGWIKSGVDFVAWHSLGGRKGGLNMRGQTLGKSR